MLQLEEGDIIRFGSVRFKIVELWIEYQDEHQLEKYRAINHPFSPKRPRSAASASSDIRHNIK